MNKDFDEYIKILEFLKEYVEKRKFLENDTELQDDLRYSAIALESIISLVQVIKEHIKYLNFLSKLL